MTEAGVMPRIYYWLHHTGRYEGNTGVQRVTRALAAALAAIPRIDLVPVRWCAEREAIIRAEATWLRGLAGHGGPVLPTLPDSGEPLHLTGADAGWLRDAWLLLPEVPHIGGGAPDAPAPALPVALDYARYYGLRSAAVFYDLIPLRVPGYEDMAASHAAYARALSAADLVLPISASSGSDLLAWWKEQGLDARRLPRVRPVLLSGEMAGSARVLEDVPLDLSPNPLPQGEGALFSPPTGPTTGRPEGKPCGRAPGGGVRFLAWGTVEPRKNQVALLSAFNALCRRRPDLDLRLDVVGGLHPSVTDAVRAEAGSSDGRIELHGYVPDEALRELVRACDASVFVSLSEGFGLPVAESLWQGKPCLCSDHGSMAEIGEGGGCLLVDPAEPKAIELGLERLADDPKLRCRLSQEARERALVTWEEYARAVWRELESAPVLSRLAVIEGSLGGGAEIASAVEVAGATVRRLHWRADSEAVLPGFRTAAEAPAIGGGDLHGLWAMLPLDTTAGPAEAMRIGDEAHGLGLKLALVIGEGRVIGGPDLATLPGADLVLFASESDRDAALTTALRELPRTATLRDRFVMARSAAEVLAAIAAQRPRITAPSLPRRPRRIFYWVGLTAMQPFNTGVQRVTRQLAVALERLGVEVVPVTWDAERDRMVHISTDEGAMLARWNGPPSRPPEPLPERLDGEWLLVPEITVPPVPPGSDMATLGRSLGMRTAAIFYDLIPERMPEVYPPEALANLRAYWRTFDQVDMALPISWTAAADLRRYLAGHGFSVPRIVPCPLAGDLPGAPRERTVKAPPTAGEPLRLLAVGTWEPRKNYPRLLRALAKARHLGPVRAIELTIVGRRADYHLLDREIEVLARMLGGVDLRAHVSDDELLSLFEASHATVYGSSEEGFGLPVLESLWRGLPCLCHEGSAMAELSAGGGVLAVDMRNDTAIARGMVQLAGEPRLLERLARQTVARPIRTWNECAEDVLAALASAGAPPGWPLPMVLTGDRRKLLTCAITTYNRAPWLTHSLPRLLDAARPWLREVEVVVCDNASADATQEVVARHAGTAGLVSQRNRVNLGMLGNLGATARASSGAFVWLLGDDDLIAEGAIEAVLTGLDAYPDVEMAYMNYAYTQFDAPDRLSDPSEVMHAALPIGHGGPNRRVNELREVAALNENLFTAIYACAFRRDHALRAYQQDVRGAPFSSLLTCIPSSAYALAALQDRPAWWVGQPAVVVNMNVSWLRWALLWHLERMPDLFDAAERAGIDPVRVDRHRAKHCGNAGEWARMALFEAEDAIRQGFSMARLLERCKHVEVFGPQVPKLRAVYADAWAAGRVVADRMSPDALFDSYGMTGRS